MSQNHDEICHQLIGEFPADGAKGHMTFVERHVTWHGISLVSVGTISALISLKCV